MKKTLLISLLFIACTAHAQWRAGISAGGDYNFYDINTQYQSDYQYEGLWGATASLFAQYNFFDWLGLRGELEMVQKNHHFYRTLYPTGYYTWNTYLQLPVMAQMSFGGQKVRGFVNLGMYAGWWIDSRIYGQIYNTLTDEREKLKQPYDFYRKRDQRCDFGLAGGLGVEYRFNEHWALHAEGRCYYSFISTVKQYMRVKDYRYNTTIGMQIGCSYIF
ncbi:MAG: PorT family protein [Paludibacteraceae bacterium]|nr:PorT family protein [Paludibacteraceae bacterium]